MGTGSPGVKTTSSACVVQMYTYLLFPPSLVVEINIPGLGCTVDMNSVSSRNVIESVTYHLHHGQTHPRLATPRPQSTMEFMISGVDIINHHHR